MSISSRFRSPLVTTALLLAAVIAPGCDRSTQAEAPPMAASDAPGNTAAVHSALDQLLLAEWKAAGVTPAPEADDATFMRRVYLDLTGVVPTKEQAAAFLASDDESKRSKLVDDLLASDAYATHWTNYWDDVLLNGGKRRLVDRPAFRQWLHTELAANVRYDEMVRRLLTATGRNSAGGRRGMKAWDLEGPPAEGVNGAVNYFLTGAQEPQNLAGTTSRVFLGQQIQCAECHDHPTEKWTQADFQSFTAAFMRVRSKKVKKGKQMGIRQIEIEDAEGMNRRMKRRMKKTGYGDKPPTALDGTSLDEANPRKALAQWMTAADNPWFARAIVNRMWGYFLGTGFVEPIDDMTSKSDVAAPKVIDKLSADFVAGGFDLKKLMREITLSTAYARAPQGAAPLWSSFALRPMNDTQLLDSLVTATGIEPVLEEVAGQRLDRIKLNLRRQFQSTFDVDEDDSADTFTGTTPQALMLLNGTLTSAGSSALAGSLLGNAARAGNHETTIEQLYLATLGRKPDPAELKHWTAYVEGASAHYDARRRKPQGGGPVGRVYRSKRLRDLTPEDVAFEDMLWTLLNSSEFFFIH